MIILKNKDEIEIIRSASKIVVEVIEILKKEIKPGISTMDIKKISKSIIEKNDAKPAFKGYNGFPQDICTSINEEVVHGIPDNNRKLKEGDIVGIDVGVIYNGFYSDGAYTFCVGAVNGKRNKLVETTKEALNIGVKYAKLGNRIGDISNAIQTYVEANGFYVVKDFVGHGIGRNLHEEPRIPNYGTKGFGPRIKSGMVLCIEPMVNIGTDKIRILKDKWTSVTADGSASAHFEHTLAITDNKTEVLTDYNYG